MLNDVQNSPDHRGVALQEVGVKGVRYPIKVKDRLNGSQLTIGTFNMYVDLTDKYKGTHMSRFIEILNCYRDAIDVENFDPILKEMRNRLEADISVLEVSFPYFIKKAAPVSHAESLMEYSCRFWGRQDSEKTDFLISAVVPVTTLCPCSKEISERGAHNQRSSVVLSIRSNAFVWLEDLIRVAEESASAELYPLLKRVDEKAVTERAYDNPRFAEDVVREVALRLDDWSKIQWYSIECENFESIHGHNAYAFLKKNKSHSPHSAIASAKGTPDQRN
jgi:GTP cyclohydrolase I